MWKVLLSPCRALQQVTRVSASKSGSFSLVIQTARHVSTTPSRLGLEEFFPDLSLHPNERNRSGRAWKVTDLRLKSDTDLHKLWYVLLKERNMLATLKWSARRLRVEMPGQERFWKLEESMDNVRKVVLERDEAFRKADDEVRRVGEECKDVAEPRVETIEATTDTDGDDELDRSTADDANKRERRSVTVEPLDNVEETDEPWMKQWDVRSFNDEELAEYLEAEKKSRQLHLMRKPYRIGSIRAIKNKRKRRGIFVNRRYSQMVNSKSPWIRPSSKFLRNKQKSRMKKFFVTGKMFSIR